jgi:pyridoxine 5-phosphate synthase
MTKLSVNLNKVATIRNTRPLGIPSITHAAKLCLDAGAHGITIHPRPDKRHIRPDDVTELAAFLKNYPHAEFNIEGNPFSPDFMPHIRRVRPTQCTLVPDSTEQFTSDHGWTLDKENFQKLAPLIAEMKNLGCRVSLFMDADSPDFHAAHDLGADRIELYTEPYASAFHKGGDALKRSLDLYAAASARASKEGLKLNAGHDLSRENLPPFIKNVPNILEVSIGHALIADALEFGLAETVRQYLAALKT